jgi:hypothetical protein
MDVIMTEPPTIFFVAAIVAVIAIVVAAPNSAPKLLHKKTVNVKNGEDGITSNSSLDSKCFCCSCSQPTPGAAWSGRHLRLSLVTEMQTMKNFGGIGSRPGKWEVKLLISKFE